MVPVETLVTVGQITLTAGDAPRGLLKEFYTRILGLTFVEATQDFLRFRHHQREVVLTLDREAPGRAGLMIRNFGEAILRLRSRKLHFEVLHTDGGLTRVAIVRDPAGNWIHLLETRAF
jgi:catechol-2,3-dioxygenase